jgi:hypothetical protein
MGLSVICPATSIGQIMGRLGWGQSLLPNGIGSPYGRIRAVPPAQRLARNVARVRLRIIERIDTCVNGTRGIGIACQPQALQCLRAEAAEEKKPANDPSP